jgi:hypothetical protein
MDDRRLGVALVALTLTCAALPARPLWALATAADPQPATGEAGTARYAGRTLAQALEDLRGAGLRLIYSTDLVRSGMKVRDEPRASELRLVLDEVLAPHGLVASFGPEGLLIVVKRTPPIDPRGAAGKALQLGFEDRFDVPGTLARDGDAAGSLRLGSRDVLGTPGAIDNIFRALQVLPGITGAGFFDTRLSVRGGAPDQNLTVMDGVEIHNPFRLFGAVAGFNPETVGRFELLAGAFPAQYGDRLSSLLVVETRDGRADEHLCGSASASVTDASAVVEGRLPGPGNGSWLFASRRTYYDLVAERIIGDGLPQFGDLQLKLAWRGGGGQRLALTAWRSREDTDADWSDPADKVVLASSGANDLVALSFAAPIGRKAILRGVASAYRFDETLELDLLGRSDTRVSFDRRQVAERGDSNDQLLALGLSRNVGVRDLALRQELDVELSPRHRLEAGAELHRLETRWRQALPGDRNDEAANGSSMLFGAGLPPLVDSSFDGTRAAAFLQHRGRFGERLLVTTGLRLERAATGADPVLSPRLLAGIDLGRAGRLKLGAGLHVQSPGYEKLMHSDYFLDLSAENRRGLEDERALHLLLGFEREFGAGLHVSLEGYYRDFSNLVVGRLETAAESDARLAPYDYPDDLAWGLPRDTLITSVPTDGAQGRAYGALASLSLDARPGRRLDGWIAYAWGRAERTAYGRSYPFDYDRPHALTAIAFCHFSPRLELGVTARVASGRPTTPPRGVLILGAPDQLDPDRDGNRDELLPARDERGQLVYVADPGGAATLNTSRLPTWARFDLRLSFSPRGPQGRWLFYIEALNVLNRRNATSYDWDIRLDPGAVRPRIEVSEGQDGFPILPTVGVRVRF